MGPAPRSWLVRWKPTPRAALGLLVAFGIGTALTLSHLDGIREAMGALPVSTAFGYGLTAAVISLLSAAVPEELLFRWALQTRLEATGGRTVALLGSAVLFTAWHLPSRFLLASGVEGSAGDLGSVLIGTGLPVFIVGLVFGWIWDRWRSLPVLIALHWSIDLLPAMSGVLGIAF